MTRTALALLCLAINIGCTQGDAIRIAESKKSGSPIVAALEDYKLDNGEYPMALDDLVPTYIGQIDPPKFGQHGWEYVRSKDRFFLYCGESVACPICSWDSQSCEWAVSRR